MIQIVNLCALLIMTNKIAILGEAWGEHEERELTPFVGPSGYLLTKLLEEAEIPRADCFLTNVLNLRPKNNKIESLCGDKKDAVKGYPSLYKGKYLRAEFSAELERLGDELIEVNPNLVIAMGNTACWALLGKTAISKLRGSTAISTHTASGFKVLPTYHPAAVLRQWELRPTTVIDLIKARREGEYPDVRRPQREIWIEPTLDDMEKFREEFINRASILSIDIETAGNAITCIGFAPSKSLALVVPFVDNRRLGRSYWPNALAEAAAWKIIKSILESPRPKKVFQNGLYDIAFIWRSAGIKVYGAEEDTMLLHHALQPESLKGLGFLGSIYTSESSWKQMRERVKTIKKDD